MANTKRVVLAVLLVISSSACARIQIGALGRLMSSSPDSVEVATLNGKYLASGTIVISHQVPERPAATEQASLMDEGQAEQPLAPLIGYFPPAVTYLPADNESWLQISRSERKITLYKGKEVVKEFIAEGDVTIPAGDYYLQHKQKEPAWYAPDKYFVNRQLVVPASSDRTRYRRGALGQFALFPTTTFPIHCSAIWSEEVGGLRLSSVDLSTIYYSLPVGTPIVVK